MADYSTLPMDVRSLLDDILRTEVPPAGAVSWAIPDGKGGFIDIPLADLSSATPSAPGPSGQGYDPYDVPTAKALQVIADYQAAQGPFIETDPTYYDCSFTDDYTQAGDEFEYRCTPSRPVATGGATVWKWRRYLEAGV